MYHLLVDTDASLVQEMVYTQHKNQIDEKEERSADGKKKPSWNEALWEWMERGDAEGVGRPSRMEVCHRLRLVK